MSNAAPAIKPGSSLDYLWKRCKNRHTAGIAENRFRAGDNETMTTGANDQTRDEHKCGGVSALARPSSTAPLRPFNAKIICCVA